MALALLLPARKRKDAVEVAVFNATLAGRAAAAKAGALAAEREFAEAIQAKRASLFGPTIKRRIVSTADIRRAESVARSYGSALRVAEEAGASAGDAVKVTAYRLDRIAATENAHAFNAAKTEDVEWRATAAGVLLMRTWDATLDRQTCEVCEGLDGTSVRVGESFAGGIEPGDVHPFCRCVETISAVN